MMETIVELFGQFSVYSKSNPVIAGAIGLWGLGVSTYFCRTLPFRFWAFLKKHLTTTIYITSQHRSFHNFMTWCEKKQVSKKMRQLKISNGRYGNDTTTTGIGYGSHIIWYNKTPLKITLSKETSDSELDKETLAVTRFGRSHDFFTKLIQNIEKIHGNKSKTHTKIHRYTDFWNFRKYQIKRELDTVCLPKTTKDKLISTLKSFENDEAWYKKHGIPYRMGILLHGPPGTGKTSIIRAICGHLEKDMYIFPAENLGKLGNAIDELPHRSIMVIEDIDSSSSVQKRAVDKPLATVNGTPVSNQVRKEDPVENFFKGSISSVLNSIDGLIDTHGRILIMTTNHPEKLDPAMKRPGRIDLELEIGNVCPEVFVAFFNKFFPEYNLPSDFSITKTLSPAEMQNMVLTKVPPKDIIKEYTDINSACNRLEIVV